VTIGKKKAGERVKKGFRINRKICEKKIGRDAPKYDKSCDQRTKRCCEEKKLFLQSLRGEGQNSRQEMKRDWEGPISNLDQ